MDDQQSPRLKFPLCNSHMKFHRFLNVAAVKLFMKLKYELIDAGTDNRFKHKSDSEKP